MTSCVHARYPLLVAWTEGVHEGPMASELLSADQREAFLDALRQGIAPGLAARAIGFTGTKLRRCRRRDREFGLECDEAQLEGNEHYRERLSATARLRALAEKGSDRILEVELATHVPGYEHLRRDRMIVDGRVEHAIVIDPQVLETLPVDRLLQFRQFLLEIGGGEIVDGEYVTLDPELPAATDNGDG